MNEQQEANNNDPTKPSGLLNAFVWVIIIVVLTLIAYIVYVITALGKVPFLIL